MSESLGIAVLELDVDARRMRQGLGLAEREVGNGMTRMLKQASRTAVGIGAYFATIKIGQFLADPLKSAGEFQQIMAVLKVQSQATTAQMQNMSKRAIKLGADIRLPAVSAQDAAKAMLELSKGGFKVQEVMQSIRPVLLLGTAAQIDFDEAAKDVVTTLRAFDIPTTRAAAVVDMLAAAAVASVADIGDITASMTFAAQSFHAAGVPIRDATTAIAELADHGQRGSVAGATLAVMMQKLANPTQKAEAAMKKLGINVWDSHGKFIGMREAIAQISPIMGKMSDKQRLATEAILGGVRGQRAINILLAGGVKEWDRIHKAVGRANLAQKLANAQTAGFNGAVAALKSSLQTLSLVLGLKLLPKATEFARFLGKVAGAKNLTVAIKIVWQGAVHLITDLTKFLNTALFGEDKIDVNIPVQIRASNRQVVDPGLVAKMIDSIKETIATTDWGPVGKAIGTAIMAFVTLADKVTKVMNKMLDAAFAWVGSHQDQIASMGIMIAGAMFIKLTDPAFWAQHWQLALGVVIAAASVFFAPERLGVMGAKLAFAMFEKFGAAVEPLVLKVLLTLPPKIGGILARAIPTLAKGFEKWVVTAIFYAIKLTAQVVEKISNGFGKLGILVRTLLFTGVVSVFPKIIEAAANQAERLAKAVVRGIKKIPGMLEGLAGEMWGKISAAIGQVAGQAGAAAEHIGHELIQGAINGIKNAPGDLAGALWDRAKGAVAKAGKLASGSGPWHFTIHTIGIPMAKGVIEGFVKGIAGFEQVMKDKIQQVADAAATMTKKNAAAVAGAFRHWAVLAKKAFGDEVDKVLTKLEAALATGKAKIDVWKAKLTPSEVQVAANQAKAALAAVRNAVTTAKAALDGLKGKQDQEWADLIADQQKNMAQLLADQKKNMDALKLTQQDTHMNAALAGHEFEKDQQAGGFDPLAIQLVGAQKALDFAKAQFKAGKATQSQLFAAQDAFDAAVIAAADDANAQKLLDDYNTWQDLLTQEATGAAAILQQGKDDAAAVLAQDTADGIARKDLLTAQYNERIEVQNTYSAAMQAWNDYWLEQKATKERIKRDAEAVDLTTHLESQFNKIKTHLEKIVTRMNKHFDDLKEDATKSGAVIGGNLAKALRDAIPLVDSAASALANTVSKYLKTHSPSEAGPLSDLDHWWDHFADTLIVGLDQKKIIQTISGAVDPQLNKGMMGVYASDRTQTAAAGNGPITLTQNFHETPADANPVAIGAVTTFALRTLPL